MQTSFIPKKIYAKSKLRGKNYGGLLMIIAVVIFVMMILVAGTVFLYRQYLTNEISKMANTLEREKGGFDTETIQELNRMDKRIELSKKILDEHMTLVPLIKSLEKNTLRRVRFDNLDFSFDGGKWLIEMDGVADSYATVALQADIFGKNNNMSELMFSNLGVNFDGNVVFNVSAVIDPRLISYRNDITSIK